jgi:NADPH-dependent glutamate synthase beta subunit-like oxidoreductase
MGLLKKNKKKKKLVVVSRGAASTKTSSARPRQVLKQPPCGGECPSGTKIRLWLQAIAQRDKLGYAEEEAFTKAWNILVETNPFPAVMGRVCPHPCETGCNRDAKDEPVGINACERFIGDWALDQKLPLTKLTDDKRDESIGVIGAGPAGLSFAYQMARRGYPVTVYEKTDKPGGMVYWGIPFYRQPADVLEAEVQRIADLGVEIKYNCAVGNDISVADIKAAHKAIYLAVGAHKGRLLRVEGEDGPGVFTGTDYLHKLNAGETVDVGDKVVVIGGGDTAIDAARGARRAGAEVTILYRRTREEMPAIDSEIEDAIKEDVKVEYLVAPVEIKRDGDKVTGVRVQKMELGEPDASGRRRPVPIEGSEYDIEVTAVVAAISQEPEMDALSEIYPEGPWVETDKTWKAGDNLWAGGDVTNLGLATIAIGQGHMAAAHVHAALSGEPIQKPDLPPIPKERLKLEIEEVYPSAPAVKPDHRPVEEWLTKPDEEIALGIDKEQFLAETARCLGQELLLVDAQIGRAHV